MPLYNQTSGGSEVITTVAGPVSVRYTRTDLLFDGKITRLWSYLADNGVEGSRYGTKAEMVKDAKFFIKKAAVDDAAQQRTLYGVLGAVRDIERSYQSVAGEASRHGWDIVNMAANTDGSALTVTYRKGELTVSARWVGPTNDTLDRVTVKRAGGLSITTSGQAYLTLYAALVCGTVL